MKSKSKSIKSSHLSRLRKKDANMVKKKNKTIYKMFKDAINEIENPCATILKDGEGKIKSFSMYPHKGIHTTYNLKVCISDSL